MRGRWYKVRTIPTDLETILSNLLRPEHRDTVSSQSRDFHAQYPRGGRNNNSFLLFSRTRATRFIAANYIAAYTAYRGNGPLLSRQWRRERAGVTIARNLSPDLPPPPRHSIPRERVFHDAPRENEISASISQLATEFADESIRSDPRSSSTLRLASKVYIWVMRLL